MVIFEKNKDKICSKYTLKRTNLQKKFLGGACPRTPLAKCPWLRDMQIPKSEKKFLPPPLLNPEDASSS